MTNTIIHQGMLTQVVKSFTVLFNSIFISSSTREFNRLKSFIAS